MEHLTLAEARKKYSNVHENGRDYGVRPVFKIYINEKPYQVWSIEGYTHETGRANGTPDDWWLNFCNKKDEDDNELTPYVDSGVHRICWEISYKQKNYAKHKWGETSIRNGGFCKIDANGKTVYTFSCSDLAYAMAKVPVLIAQLMEHPFDFLDPKSEHGRKIWYYGMPATVSVNEYSEPGEISIVPDYSTGIEPNRWWKLYRERKNPVIVSDSEVDPDDMDHDDDDLGDLREHSTSSSRINHGDALWDGMINWFRKGD
jgi:hypothetical protein